MKNPHIILLVDLDGTITDPAINNTYNFIEIFYKVHKMNKRILLLNFLFRNILVIRRFISIFKLGKVFSIDGILISVLFFGIKKQKLEIFSHVWSKILSKASLFNADIMFFIEQAKKMKNIKLIMFTACSEMPACVIAELLGFHYCIARRFITIRGLIIATRDLEDVSTFKYSKLIKLLNTFKSAYRKIYIIDIESAKSEFRLITSGLFDLVLIYTKQRKFVSLKRIKTKHKA